MHRVHSGLGWLGIFGAVAWISLIVLMAGGWGPPGSAEYDRYATNSQLWVFAFALMACGFIGLFLRYKIGAATALGLTAVVSVVLGFVLMMAGNVAEFRYFSHLPYESDNARMWAWLVFLLGFLSVLAGSLLLGVWARRQELRPRWTGWMFLLALPATFVAAAASLHPVPLCLATLAAGTLAVRRTSLPPDVSGPATLTGRA
ncbi:hypothetical protein [Pseudarthrobacter sp. MM222]|uniref:hypothetical protein n=1 Tax=Pseudarthrobacter sp. MM222 TaxID=3018929 RepID=UPI00221E5866|nr:hypothetical protein [Pseudarthrobacter sp. MM222]CAI3799327.1 hypothetical protein NKCBBBOE_02298 [Pseudarthrobacter sp. MM222]